MTKEKLSGIEQEIVTEIMRTSADPLQLLFRLNISQAMHGVGFYAHVSHELRQGSATAIEQLEAKGAEAFRGKTWFDHLQESGYQGRYRMDEHREAELEVARRLLSEGSPLPLCSATMELVRRIARERITLAHPHLPVEQQSWVADNCNLALLSSVGRAIAASRGIVREKIMYAVSQEEAEAAIRGESSYRRCMRSVARRVNAPELIAEFPVEPKREIPVRIKGTNHALLAVYDPNPPTVTPAGTIRNSKERIGRNDPCPCGCGKKYKNCLKRKRGDDVTGDTFGNAEWN